MTKSGWYPDPAGQEGHFRYWNGEEWSHETTTDPTFPPPASPESDSPKGRKGLVILGVIIGVVLVLVAAGLAGAFLVSRNQAAVADQNSSTPTGSAWDEQEKTPTPEKSPSALATPKTFAECEIDNSGARAKHPEDDEWLYGGNLAMRRYKDWGPYGTTFPWATDTMTQGPPPFNTDAVDYYVTAVSAIPVRENFENPKQAASSTLACKAMSMSLNEGTEDMDPVFSKPIQVDGKPGHWVRGWIKIDDPETQPGVKGEMLDIVVVDQRRHRGFDQRPAGRRITPLFDIAVRRPLASRAAA